MTTIDEGRSKEIGAPITLTETSEELTEALSSTLALVFGKEEILTGPIHTGGGVMVMTADLSIDGRGMGRQLWLTREGEREWLLGVYDFYADEEDEGICVAIHCPNNYVDGVVQNLAESPFYVAGQVAGLLTRLGVTKLQGE